MLSIFSCASWPSGMSSLKKCLFRSSTHILDWIGVWGFLVFVFVLFCGFFFDVELVLVLVFGFYIELLIYSGN